MDNHLWIQFSKNGIIFCANGKNCDLLIDKITRDKRDPVLNSICLHLGISIDEMIETLCVFDNFFYNQPERLSEKTSKEDAIV